MLALAAGFEREPERLFSEITPPYSLVWENFAKGSFFTVTDGLGVAKLYEYSDGKRWALTNRISAFAAFGLELEPDLTNWAARWALNFFPLELTGFRNVRSLAPGTRISVSRDGVRKESHASQLHWITPSSLARSEILESARASNRLPRFLRRDVVEKVREIVSSPFTVARSWGLADKEALQFLISQRYTSNFERYFCYESNFTITPYFSRGIVNAGFSLPIPDLKSNPVHRYIVETDVPDWAGVEYESEMTARLKAASRSGLAPGLDPALVTEAPAWMRPTGNEPYNRGVFWQELGAPAIEAEIEKGGAWEEIYDPDLVRATWQKSPEEFLIVAMLPKAFERLNAAVCEDVA